MRNSFKFVLPYDPRAAILRTSTIGIVNDDPESLSALSRPDNRLSVKVGCLAASYTVVLIDSLRRIGDTCGRTDKEVRITQNARWRTCIKIKKLKDDQKTNAVFNSTSTASFDQDALCRRDQCGYAGEPSRPACFIILVQHERRPA